MCSHYQALKVRARFEKQFDGQFLLGAVSKRTQMAFKRAFFGPGKALPEAVDLPLMRLHPHTVRPVKVGYGEMGFPNLTDTQLSSRTDGFPAHFLEGCIWCSCPICQNRLVKEWKGSPLQSY